MQLANLCELYFREGNRLEIDKIKWVEGVTDLELEAIGKLRRDADLRYLYQGEYSGRGRPRKYSGKVDLTDHSNFELVTRLTDDVELYRFPKLKLQIMRQAKLISCN